MPVFKTLIAAAAFFTVGVTEGFAGPIFYGTSDPSRWEVAVNAPTSPSRPGEGGDGQFSSFPTSGFVTATQITLVGREDWIANNTAGNNGFFSYNDWTFYVFRQTFDLTGYDPATAHLTFQWAADDSGRGGDQTSWRPKYSLNSGPLVAGTWPDDVYGPGNSYSYGGPVDLSGGFVSGLNTLTFYVEGNGTTDGFALRTLSFTADSLGDTVSPAPEPASCLLFGLGALGLCGYARVRRTRAGSDPVPA